MSTTTLLDIPQKEQGYICAAFWRAIRLGGDEAEGEMNRRILPLTLTWAEVFETDYTVEDA